MSKLLYKIRLILTYRDFFRTRIPFLYRRMINKAQERTKLAAKRLKDKKKIEVAFLLTTPGMWKLDYVFKLMQQDPLFHPYIVIFPYSQFKDFSESELWNTIKRTEDFIKVRGFEYIIPYNEQTNRWKDIRKELNPDIVFFTTPYRDILPQFYYYHFKDKITCYVSYSFQAMNAYRLDYDQISLNMYSAIYAETKMHKHFAETYGRSKGRNYFVTGYPGTEIYLRQDYKAKDVWKSQDITKKRVIWAPHHTIDNNDDFQSSTFLVYAEQMLYLAKKYKDTIQFAFKPHQLLKFKLYKLWGEERTDNYYKQWQDAENTQLEETGYTDLFIGSDAMIHDSGSFTVEYLFLNKPTMFLVSNHQKAEQLFNDFGVLAYNQHYHGYTESDIEAFLSDIVLGQNDNLQQSRTEFIDTYLRQEHNELPSELIVRHIKKTIFGE